MVTDTLSAGKDKQKVIAAIIAGVNAYLQSEELSKEVGAERVKLVAPVKLWSVKGREEIMMMRMLWQRRMA